MTGTKRYDGPTLLLDEYKGKMGAGYLDANLLLENIKVAFGEKTPPRVTARIANRLLKTDTPTSSVALADYFTDDAVSQYDAVANDESVVRVNVSDGVLRMLPKKVGQARVTVSARGFEGHGRVAEFLCDRPLAEQFRRRLVVAVSGFRATGLPRREARRLYI